MFTFIYHSSYFTRESFIIRMHRMVEPIHCCRVCMVIGAILLWAGRQGKSLHDDSAIWWREFIRLDESLVGRSGASFSFFCWRSSLSLTKSSLSRAAAQCVDFYCWLYSQTPFWRSLAPHFYIRRLASGEFSTLHLAIKTTHTPRRKKMIWVAGAHGIAQTTARNNGQLKVLFLCRVY